MTMDLIMMLQREQRHGGLVERPSPTQTAVTQGMLDVPTCHPSRTAP